MRIRLPESSRNFLTLTGLLLVVVGSCIFWAMFLLIAYGFIPSSAYLGVVLYMVMPVPIFMGLVLIPFGMYRNRRQVREKIVDKPFPVVDLNVKRHRNAVAIFSSGTIFVGFFIMFFSYQGFHYTESTEFCGRLCHTVMEPEYVTYSHSAHARVACVQCHVGAGADWYAKSKLSGLYQVYATIAGIYPRPIDTPIKDLRPARETCEQCHWPGKLFPARERRFNHFIEEEENKHWPINMIVEIGGQSADYEEHPGSHWHVHPDVKVEYIATDHERNEIPWIRYTNTQTGEQTIFQSEYDPIEESELAEHEIRTMDCMDCHNRPSHSYKPPFSALNDMMFSGDISKVLPEIKSIARDLLTQEYSDSDSAVAAISAGLMEYYQDSYPGILQENPGVLNATVSSITEYYKQNFFPLMKARWDVYPNQLGHLEFPGCYRCHDGTHVSESGKTITNECSACHTIIQQGEILAADRNKGLEFKHPIDIGEAWRDMACYECHSPDNY